ncbi:hypothetical protein BDZ94DRAFT_1271445 [Collybia nuda]|uniref:Uncharacterized protein n=1 Tax=Collybia nuda TaxID=64659 RepID=A0A9P6CA91_9AGAR|nr:hypothetical protein BDZ94DRAFT_1271445 [Collybia nuda]
MVVIGLHFGVIIVGGRAWALCFRLAAGCDTSLDLEAASQDQKSNSEYAWDHIDRYRKIPFYRYVAYCERVQLIGTLLLLISMLLMQFALFSNKIFSWIFLGVPATLAVSIYLTDFRH